MSSNITDPYPIVPFTVPANATVRVPGSKSITNRALAMAALCNRDLKIFNALRSRDTEIMEEALKALGIKVKFDPQDSTPDEGIRDLDTTDRYTVSAKGFGHRFPNKKAFINVGNAGTAARFLTALLCLQEDGEYVVDGDEEMYKRPMKGLTDALATLGAEFNFHKTPGCIPFTVKTHGIIGDRVSVDASESSQILSALLIMAGGVGRPFEVELKGETVSEPFVKMTVDVLKVFGVRVKTSDSKKVFSIQGPFRMEPCAMPEMGPDFISPNDYFPVEPDATAASYFMALPISAKGQVVIRDLNDNEQGDFEFRKVLSGQAGMVIEGHGEWSEDYPCQDDIIASIGSTHPNGVRANFNAFSDTFLTLAALTPLLDGMTRIEGLAHTRKQETDRVAAMAAELRKLGQTVLEENDALEVHPDLDALKRIALEARTVSPSGCIEIDTYHDHRVAMSFAILGCRDLLDDGKPWLALRDPLCCKKTFPNFYEVLEGARQQSLKAANKHSAEAAFTTVAIDGGAATGKSSTSRGLAKKLGFMHVDTGSHYRALTLLFLNHKVGPTDAEGIATLLKNSPLETRVDKNENDAKITVDGKVPNDTDLRSDAVNAAVSKFAAVPAVRDALKEYQRNQREIAKTNGYHGLVMEGRDIGSVIFPDAELKIFLEADEATRAKRRAGQGQSDAVGERDKMDASRKTAPLVCPEGAVRLDNSHMTLDEVIDNIASMVAALRYK